MDISSWLLVAAIVALGVAVYLSAIYTGLARLDETIRPHSWTCHLCRDTWFGTSKVCERCGSPGYRGEPYPLRVPAVWWPGHDHGNFTEIDTGPIRIPRHRAS